MRSLKALAIGVIGVVVGIAIIVAGCKTAYDSGGGAERANADAAATPAATDAAGDAAIAAGMFADSSHDNPSSIPPVLGVAEESEEGAETFSHFRAIQIDPAYEDSAGPKFIIPGDINNDGLVDLLTAWNESQPVQIHLQKREGGTVSFEAINIAGTYPIGICGGIELADFDGDGWLDIVVAVKHNGEQAICGDAQVTWCGMGPAEKPFALDADVGEVGVLFSPGSADRVRDGAAWSWLRLADGIGGWSSRLDGRRDESYEQGVRAPEFNSYSAVGVGDLTCDGYPDVVVCFNPAKCKEECEEFPINRLVMYANPGPGAVKTAGGWNEVWIYASSGPIIKSCAVDDVDDDDDLDVVFTLPNASSPNISWARNPCNNDANGPGGTARTLVGQLEVWYDGEPYAWETRPVGHIASEADVLALGDADGDGYNDVLVRTNDGHAVLWFRRPTGDDLEPIFPPTDPPVPVREGTDATSWGMWSPQWNFPWPTFVVTEFDNRIPEGIAFGDVTADGQVEAVVAAGGAIFWYEYDPESPGGVYDQWVQNFIVDDSKAEGQTVDPMDPDFEDKGTYVNNVLVLDVDGDGANDIIATLDRRTKSGLADDSLIWFRNTILDPAEPAGGNE